MPNVSAGKAKFFEPQGADTDIVSAVASATSLVIADAGPYGNLTETITVTSPSGNNTGITFETVGKDANGAAQTVAATTGPGAGITVSVTGTWSEVTSITASGAITTSISAGVTSGATTGIVFAGRTRIRGMNGVAGAGAGHVFFKNSSATTGANKFVLDIDNGEAIAPYIPDNGILFPDGAYFAYDGTAVVGLSVQYDG